MISYKNIDMLQLTIDDNKTLLNKETPVEIKSPIMLFSLNENEDFLNFSVNRDAENHCVFLNLSRYIERLYNFKNIESNLNTNDSILIYAGKDINYQIFDSDNKNTTREKIKYGGKAIFSFVTNNGRHELIQLLMIK
tara:strand:- start:10915 stop:11325 length:411 start_codon:yes stop_codon:yes gene_type:complete